MNKEITNKMLQEVLNETAEILRTGKTARKIKIGLTTLGSDRNMIYQCIRLVTKTKYMPYWKNSWTIRN